MTDTLHSRILRTIEDWNTDHSMGLGPGDTAVLAGRILVVAQGQTSLRPPEMMITMREELQKYIQLIDFMIKCAENSDAEEERDEFAVKFYLWVEDNRFQIETNEQKNFTLSELVAIFKEDKKPKGEFTNPKHNYKSLLP